MAKYEVYIGSMATAIITNAGSKEEAKSKIRKAFPDAAKMKVRRI